MDPEHNFIKNQRTKSGHSEKYLNNADQVYSVKRIML